MSNIPTIFAKLAGIYKITAKEVRSVEHRVIGVADYHPVSTSFIEYFEKFSVLRQQLKSLLPKLYSDLPDRKIPKELEPGYLSGFALAQLVRDIEYIFEVRDNNMIGEPQPEERPERIFISHGSGPDWREVQAYIEKDLKLDTLELAQEPNRGRTVLQKLGEESSKCSFAVVVMTGDDQVGEGVPHVRENVMHEIGFFQGKFGLANVCLLYEEGTNIPSNIHGVVYIPFPKNRVSATFGALARELRYVFTKSS